MKQELLKEIRLNLQQCADDSIRESSDRFFKKGEKALVYGVGTTEVRKIAKEFGARLKTLSKKDALILCEELWKSQYLEEAIIACVFTESLKKQYEPSDFKIFEHWVKTYVNNWAACDTLCNHTIGSFIMMYPEYLHELKNWAKLTNRWTKRASAVTLIIPARKGLFLEQIFEIANILLSDKDDMVQKGYGWMLKAASESHQKEVFDFVISKKDKMPRTAFRYAIEKMPEELKARAMKK
jgi:3-methyladenine DNA glycosylase AlkD